MRRRGITIKERGDSTWGVGVVIIGRNEGSRLRRCLESVPGKVAAVVYVDSGSIDGSVELAKSKGAQIIELDTSLPFTAARARNAGFQRLLTIDPGITSVQFVDGDCEIADGWLKVGLKTIKSDHTVVAVCGRRREGFIDRSIFNRLCDLEWNLRPVGETPVFGGDVLIRVSGFCEVGGYNPSIIAAEDDDLSVRLRERGWRILRLDVDMTTHDAAMLTIGQWWKRAVRFGYAVAQVSAQKSDQSLLNSHFRPERNRLLVWGLAFPVAILALAWPTSGLSFVFALVYPFRVTRIAVKNRSLGWSRQDAWVWGVSCVASSFPQVLGAARFYADRILRVKSQIIEYKRTTLVEEKHRGKEPR